MCKNVKKVFCKICLISCALIGSFLSSIRVRTDEIMQTFKFNFQLVLPVTGILMVLHAQCSSSSSQWRPLEIPGTHPPYSTMQLVMDFIK